MSVKLGWTATEYGPRSVELPAQDKCILGPADATGIILAGVHNWGHEALEDVVCRPLLPIAGRPLIRHVINWFHQEGVSRAVVCANSNTRILRGNLGGGEGLGVSLEYYEDQMPRGPAGCARDAASAASGNVYVVAEGTIVPKVNLAELLETHQRRRAALTVVMADLDPADERAGATPEPVGIYLFSPSAFEHVPASGYQDIKETLIPRLYAEGERVAIDVVSAGLAPRVTGAASYLAVNMWAVQGMGEKTALSDGYIRVDDGWVHESAVVDSTARIIGLAVVGPECVVGPGAIIAGPATVGTGCRIEHHSVISRSAIWDKCTIGAGAIVDGSILADGTCIESEVIVRNTVITPQRRSRHGILKWLVGHRQSTGDRAGYAKKAHARPVVMEPESEATLPHGSNGLRAATSLAPVRSRRFFSPTETESRC